MKYAQFLKNVDERAPPQLRGKFISYKALKKVLKRVTSATASHDAARSEFEAALDAAVAAVDAVFHAEAAAILATYDAAWGEGAGLLARLRRWRDRRGRRDEAAARSALALRAAWCRRYARVNTVGLRKIVKKYGKTAADPGAGDLLQSYWEGRSGLGAGAGDGPAATAAAATAAHHAPRGARFLTSPLLTELRAVEALLVPPEEWPATAHSRAAARAAAAAAAAAARASPARSGSGSGGGDRWARRAASLPLALTALMLAQPPPPPPAVALARPPSARPPRRPGKEPAPPAPPSPPSTGSSSGDGGGGGPPIADSPAAHAARAAPSDDDALFDDDDDDDLSVLTGPSPFAAATAAGPSTPGPSAAAAAASVAAAAAATLAPALSASALDAARGDGVPPSSSSGGAATPRGAASPRGGSSSAGGGGGGRGPGRRATYAAGPSSSTAAPPWAATAPSPTVSASGTGGAASALLQPPTLGGSRSSSVADAAALDAALRCPICLDYMYRPLGLTCGHAFCTECALRSVGHGGDVGTLRAVLGALDADEACPECRRPAAFAGARPMRETGALVRARHAAAWAARRDEARARDAARRAFLEERRLKGRPVTPLDVLRPGAMEEY